MADKPLDILAPEVPAQSAPDAVDLAFAGMFDAAKGCFANIAYTARSTPAIPAWPRSKHSSPSSGSSGRRFLPRRCLQSMSSRCHRLPH